MACSSLTVMAGATIAPALPLIAQHFQAQRPGDASVTFWAKLALTGPGLFTAIVSLLVGVVCDRIGRLPVLVAGLVLYIIAGTSGLYLNNLWVLLVGRALLGAAVAMVMVATTATIADRFVGPQRQRFNGMQAMAMSWGGVLFLTVAGLLADAAWRYPFAIYFLPLPLLVLAPLALRASAPAATSVTTMLQGGAGGKLGAATAGTEALQRGVFAFLLALGFVGMVLFYMIPTTLPFYMKEIGIAQQKWVGIAIATNGLIAGLVSLAYGPLKARMSFPAVTALQFVIMGTAYLLLSQAQTLGAVLAIAALNGVGQGLMLPNLLSWAQSKTPAHLRGRLMGFITSSVFLGQFCSPIITSPIAARVGLAKEWAIAGGFMLALSLGFGVYAAMAKQAMAKQAKA